MPKPKVIETLDAFKAEVRNNEKDAMLLMAKRWNAVERGLDAQIAALTQEIDALRAIDKLPTANQLYRMERYKTLLAQTQREVGQYERFAQGEIERGQREYFALGNDAAQAMLRDLTPAGVNINFNRLPVDAVNNMIGYCKDGAPLFSVLKERALYPDAIDGLTTQLVNAMALGFNPRKTARLMKDGLAQGLTKALVIARTEQLRAFREASFQNYNKNSDIVKGWVWHSALGTRTCAACYAMHGTIHPLDERLEDHPSGRCAMIPISKGWKELGYDVPDTNPTIPSGEEEFAKLDEQQQLGVLGKGRYELYKAGKLDFGKLATFTDDKVWGRSLRIAPLGDIGGKLPVPTTGLLYHPNKLDTENIIERNIDALKYATGHPREDAEKMLNDAVDKLQDVVNNNKLAVHSPPDAAKMILQDGRFKTQFETGTSKGKLSFTDRAIAAEKGLGIPQNVSNELRPIHGLVKEGKCNAMDYGKVQWVFKDTVRERTTVTFGNSLGGMHAGIQQGAPINKVNGAVFEGAGRIYDFVESGRIPKYIEIQIQGPVKLDDVAEILILKSQKGMPDADWVYNEAKRLGIPVNWVGNF